MKNVVVALGAFLTLFLVSCEGDPGPPGSNGINGEDGVIAQVFEVEGLNFDYLPEDNLFETILPFSDFTSFEVLATDAVLVYRFDRTVSFDDGGEEDVWSLVPLNFFLEQGTIQYLSGHTTRDVEVLISGDFDIANLDPGFTDNQLFRIAIIPGEAASAKMDTSNIDAVMSSLGVTEDDVQKVRIN